MMPSGVRTVVNKYWREGISGGMILVDAVVLILSLVDVIRFTSRGFSLSTAWRVTLEAAAQGESIGLAIAVFLFFVIAMPMVLALLYIVLPPAGKGWPHYLRMHSGATLLTHLALKLAITLFTITAVTMEVLSGYTNEGGILGRSFMSAWLVVVFMGKPVYAFYISPIIRKFLIRVSADHHTKVSDVVQEVVTQESMGAGHG